MANDLERHLIGDQRIAIALLISALCVCLFGIGIGGYQCILWLRDGYWTEMPLASYIPQNSNMNWDGARGLERIWDWFLDFPTSWAVFLVGAISLAGAVLRWIETSNRLFAARQRDLM